MHESQARDNICRAASLSSMPASPLVGCGVVRAERLGYGFVKPLLLSVIVVATSISCGETEEYFEWRVGCARVSITPEEPIVLLGYGDRTQPFQYVAQDIYAKALAFEDKQGHRAVIVTADLVGFQAAVITETVRDRIRRETGLGRSQLLFNASHSHTGPLVSLDPWSAPNAIAHAPLSLDDRRRTIAYTRLLRDKLVAVARDAISRLEPAQLSWGKGSVSFPTNRRLPRDGRIAMADNPQGKTDRSVPVLGVRTPAGKYLAILFGCACHNTTLTGADNVISGDYAGFAQSHLEERFPGAQAMYMSGCGADANPSPRGSMKLAEQHGKTLAEEVARIAERSLEVVRGDFGTAYETVDLPLHRLAKSEIEERARLSSAEAVTARQMLKVLEAGETLPTEYAAPVAAWQFGRAFTLVALPGEPVAEYVDLISSSLPDQQLWIAGYNNDCFGYLPTAQIVEEGGHENIGVTLWLWGRNLHRYVGFFAPSVQQTIVSAVARIARR